MKVSGKIVLALGCAALCAAASAQEQTVKKQSGSSSQQRSETSVEDEYYGDVDGVVIMSLATSDDYDNKLVAMQYIEDAIDNGNTSEDIMTALNQLAGEGVTSQSRTNGRLTNNYPDIRRRACLTLGKVKTEQAKDYLVTVTLAESEPMVIAAAVNSLGEIGLNNGDEVVDAISYANRRNQILNPTSSLAFEVLDAYEKLASSTENKKILIDSVAKIAADYHYVKPVRDKARKLLQTLSESGDSKSGSDKKSGGNADSAK